MDVQHLSPRSRRPRRTRARAFVEIYQNCKIFNDGVFEYATDKAVKADNILYLEHGKPMIFGKDSSKGIRLNGLKPEVVTVGKDCQIDDLLTHDEHGRRADAGVPAEPVPARPAPARQTRSRNRSACSAASASRPTRRCSTTASRPRPTRSGPGKIEDLFKAEDVWTVS